MHTLGRARPCGAPLHSQFLSVRSWQVPSYEGLTTTGMKPVAEGGASARCVQMAEASGHRAAQPDSHGQGSLAATLGPGAGGTLLVVAMALKLGS